MQEDPLNRSSVKNITKTLLAFKAARISLGLNRRQAAERCSCSVRALEQLENGRCNYTEDRIRRLVRKMGMEWEEFQKIESSPEQALAKIDAYNFERTLARKPRRNLYKLVTKEVRAIRVLRKRRGISQYKASEVCGFKECTFGLIEAGRSDLTEEKIDHILKSLGYKRQDFDRIVRADVIADEVISEINSLLELLDDSALNTVFAMIKALAKK